MKDTVDVVENIGLIELDTAILLIALRKRMRIDLKEDLKGLVRNSVMADEAIAPCIMNDA